MKMLIKKIPGTSGLVTIAVLNTKFGEVEKKISDTSSLVITTVVNTNIGEVKIKIPDHAKYITAPEFNTLTAEKFTAGLNKLI